MYEKFYFEEERIFSPFIKLKFYSMHFLNGFLIFVFLCDMSGRINLVGRASSIRCYLLILFYLSVF